MAINANAVSGSGGSLVMAGGTPQSLAALALNRPALHW